MHLVPTRIFAAINTRVIPSNITVACTFACRTHNPYPSLAVTVAHRTNSGIVFLKKCFKHGADGRNWSGVRENYNRFAH